MTFKVFMKNGDNGRYIASVPSLPSCHSQGETIDQASMKLPEVG